MLGFFKALPWHSNETQFIRSLGNQGCGFRVGRSFGGGATQRLFHSKFSAGLSDKIPSRPALDKFEAIAKRIVLADYRHQFDVTGTQGEFQADDFV